MDIGDLKLINENIISEIKKNNELIQTKKEEKSKIPKINALKTKINNIAKYFIGTYVFLNLLLLIGGATLLTSLVPASFSPFIVGITSMGIGCSIERITNKDKKSNQSIFSLFKNRFKNYKKRVDYSLEIEKLKNKNTVMKQVKELINTNPVFIKMYTNDDFMTNSKEESEEKIKKISTNLKEKYNEIDKLTTKKVLIKYFWECLTKNQLFEDIMLAGYQGTIFSMICCYLPLIVFKDYIVLSSAIAHILPIIGPIILGFAGGSAYVLKRNKDYQKVFDEVNNEYDDLFPEKIENPNLEIKIANLYMNKTLKELFVAESQLRVQEKVLESFTRKDGKNEVQDEPIIGDEKKVDSPSIVKKKK